MDFKKITRNPLFYVLVIGVLLIVVAVQMVSLGLLAELVVNLRRRRHLDATADGDLQ